VAIKIYGAKEGILAEKAKKYVKKRCAIEIEECARRWKEISKEQAAIRSREFLASRTA